MSQVHSKSTLPAVESDADLESSRYSLQKFTLYETQTRFYLIGRDKSRAQWRVLKIDRSEPSELNIYEDPAIYTRQDCNDLLSRLAEGNRLCGGVNFVTKAYGVVGFIKFLEPYYMILITKRQLLGNICGHSIYGICESRLVTVPHPSILTDLTRSKAESRYKRLFNSIDLSRDFFYSYTYRVMWSLQRNANAGKAEIIPFDDMFVWNSFLTRKFRSEHKSSHWTVALVHGFFRQVKLVCENTDFTLTLIARRSRHFAGTRYLKRGANEKGRVANDVETEQLVHDEEKMDRISSIVQHRGSIPLYWSQETSALSPKPDIILHKNDPTYEATNLHFQNLATRYGNPIVVLNLVKTVEKRPRETILCREFASSVAYLNHILPKTDRIKFIQWDFHMFSKRKSTSVLGVLESIAVDVLDLIGFYYSGNASENNSDIDLPISLADASNGLKHHANNQQPAKRMFQHGVLRTNCIDCLDRTNVAQYAFGLAALGRQMHALGLCSTPRASSNSSLAIALMELYENMGDVLALQYGGSPAHNKVFSQCLGKWNATIQSQEFFRSLVRHYNNTYLDGEKQDAINIFLGHFHPEVGKLALWQLDSDNHLQIRRAGDDPMNDLRLSFKRSLSAGNMLEQNENTIVSPEAVSETDSNLINKSFSVKNPSLNMAKRGVTISEAELKKCLADDGGYGSFSDVRYLVSATGSSNWQGGGLPSDTVRKSEDSYDHNDYFQDLTTLLINAKSHNWKDDRDVRRESNDDMNSVGVEDVKMAGSGGAEALHGLFSERFVNWIQEGQTLCF